MASWSNWSGRLTAKPTALHFLRSERDAAAVVQRALADGHCVRAQGAGHSHAPLVGNDHCIIDTSALAGLVSVNPAQRRARVWAGTPIYMLGRLFGDHGLALANQGDIDRQAIAGAVATGTHGTGTRLQNLSATVVGLRLVTADGQVLECNADTESELFTAARLSLGAFGLITQLELALLPAYRLRESGFVSDLASVVPQLATLCAAHRHVEFFWYPQADRAIVKIIDETQDAAEYPLAAEGARCADSHEVLPNHRPYRHTEMEYSVPAALAADCLLELAALIRTEFPQISWPVEYRTLAADEVWLSTAYEQQTVTISVHQDIAESDHEYFSACERVFLRYQGRPHWGKVHYLNGATLAERHPRWADWWRVRDAIDPQGVFLNPYLKSLRTDTGRSAAAGLPQ